ncbi:hypothetical protein DYB36_007157, partial [Aphanomyces astaci]
MYGGLPPSSQLHSAPPRTPAIPPSPPKDAHDKCVVTVVDDSKYSIDGTFSVQTESGVVYHGISGLRLEPTGKASETPRYVDTFVHKMAYFRKGYALCSLGRYAEACVEFRK